LKKLLVGESITWDTLAVALGYLGQQISQNQWYGNMALEKKGSALAVGKDKWGNQVFVLGSAQPKIIKKVVQEISKLGYPRVAEVEVISIKLPGQRWLRWLVKMARWKIIGTIALRLTAWVAGF